MTSFPTAIWDIVAAIGTVAAVVSALLLGLHDSRAQGKRQAEELPRLALERDQARTARDAAEAAEETRNREAQARKVSIWTEDDPGLAPEVPRSIMMVGNYSEAPVFDLNVQFQSHDGPRSFRPIPALWPGGTTPLDQLDSPGISDWTRPPDIVEECTVTFRDISGNSWTRDLAGQFCAASGVPRSF